MSCFNVATWVIRQHCTTKNMANKTLHDLAIIVDHLQRSQKCDFVINQTDSDNYISTKVNLYYTCKCSFFSHNNGMGVSAIWLWTTQSVVLFWSSVKFALLLSLAYILWQAKRQLLLLQKNPTKNPDALFNSKHVHGHSSLTNIPCLIKSRIQYHFYFSQMSVRVCTHEIPGHKGGWLKAMNPKHWVSRFRNTRFCSFVFFPQKSNVLTIKSRATDLCWQCYCLF